MLNRSSLKNSIKDVAMRNFPERPDDPERREEWENMRTEIIDWADGLADAIDDYVRGLVITIPSGTILTAGSAASQVQSNVVRLQGDVNIG